MMMGAVTVANVFLALFGPAGPFPLLGEGATTLAGDILPVAASLVAVWCLVEMLGHLAEWESLKVSWALLAAGISLSCLGETSWGIMEALLGLDMDAHFPSVADLFWLAAYPLILAGLVIKFMAYRKSGLGLGRGAFHAALAGAFAAAVVVVTRLLIAPILADTGTSLVEKGVLAAYPVLDLVILAPAVTLAYVASLFGGGRVASPWRMLSAGFCLWTVSDIAYGYLELTGAYTGGHIIDLGWNLSYLFIAAAALLQRDLLASFAGGCADA